MRYKDRDEMKGNRIEPDGVCFDQRDHGVFQAVTDDVVVLHDRFSLLGRYNQPGIRCLVQPGVYPQLHTQFLEENQDKQQ